MSANLLLFGMQYVVRFSEYLPVGMAVLMRTETGAPALFCRHPSEWALHMAQAEWHPSGERCPTLVDGECRCMLGGEA